MLHLRQGKVGEDGALSGSNATEGSVACELFVTNACRLQGPPGGTGFRNYAGAAKQAAATSVGHMKTGMIFVDFSDVPATETPKSTFDKFMPDAAKWYYDASYGRLNMTMEADTTKWHRMPGISSSYNINRRLTYPIFAKYLNDAAKSASPKFGNIDVLYVTANRAAKAITTSPTYMGPIKYASGQSKRAVMFGNDFYNWGFKELNHETGHTMGLPDLYPLDGSNKPTTFYVGGWDLMGLISGPAPDYFAWHKWLLGWIDDDQVSCITMKGSSQQTISPLHVKGGTKMVAIKLNETTLLGIELRTKGGNDVRTCSEGLVFYTIAVDKGSGRGCLVVHDPRPSKAKECSARGGQLSGAAMDFGKGEKDISLPQLGVTVKVTGNVDGNYQFTINYEGGR
ncbi:M6 metalloprotease [Tothia fuscella]|uniref:M6 metalloprotease n=1 Tax=Tothia fuscella TaxID=1048955 RepID=A0A9P4TSX8_9PEZI|nr:M6 metalloprotease [Tothia fuscella]